MAYTENHSLLGPSGSAHVKRDSKDVMSYGAVTNESQKTGQKVQFRDAKDFAVLAVVLLVALCGAGIAISHVANSGLLPERLSSLWLQSPPSSGTIAPPDTTKLLNAYKEPRGIRAVIRAIPDMLLKSVTSVTFPKHIKAPPGLMKYVLKDCNRPESCTTQALDKHAGQYTCGQRINFLISVLGYDELKACGWVGGVEFSAQCGECNPYITDSDGRQTDWWSEHSLTDCYRPEDCTEAVLDTYAGFYTCRQRMQYLMRVKGDSQSLACAWVGGVEFSRKCGQCNPFGGAGAENRPVPCEDCQFAYDHSVSDCYRPEECTDDVLDTRAGLYTCRDHIEFRIRTFGEIQSYACGYVARDYRECSKCMPPYDS